MKNTVDWGKWPVAEKFPLDGMDELHMYWEPTYIQKGASIQCSVLTYLIKNADKKKAKILLMDQYLKEKAYLIKNDGRKKAKNGCNGSVLKGRGVDYAQTYSSCASQVGMKIFTAIAALTKYIIMLVSSPKETI